MGASLYFIEIWLKLLDENYDNRRVDYNTAMKEMPRQIPTTMTKPFSPRQKVEKIMTEISYGWCMKNISKGLPPLTIPKLSKKNRREGGWN